MIGICEGTWLAKAISRLLSHGGREDVIELAGEVRAPLLQGRNGGLYVLLHDVFAPGADVGSVAGQELVKDDSQRIHIGSWSGR